MQIDEPSESPQTTADNRERKPFLERLRTIYKDSLVNIKPDRIQINVVELNRVVLECAQKRLIEHALEFSYTLDEDGLDKFTSEAETSILKYGNMMCHVHYCSPWE